MTATKFLSCTDAVSSCEGGQRLGTVLAESTRLAKALGVRL